MGWNERSDPDMRTANFCDVYREGVYWADISDTWAKAFFIPDLYSARTKSV